MTDSATAISAAPFVALAAPYIVAVAGVFVPALVGMCFAEARKLTGIKIQQAAIDKLSTFAKAEAGALIAASATNLAGEAIPVGSLMIAQAAKRIIDAAPSVLAEAGVTPASVATMVAGHLGAMQAGQGVTAVAAATPPAA